MLLPMHTRPSVGGGGCRAISEEAWGRIQVVWRIGPLLVCVEGGLQGTFRGRRTGGVRS